MLGVVRRATAAAGALTLAGLALAPAAAAASGTWGAGHYRYADGTVCRTGAQTSPLAAWDVAGGARAYLTRALTSDGVLDSGAPPIPSAGTPLPATDVTPGAEFPSAGDIATFAYLIGHGGNPATVAAAVLGETDAAHVPACADAAAASALLATSQERAGPYQLTVTGPTGAVHPGTPVQVTATVLSAAGAPVPGVRVTFTAAGATFASTATTGADGTAHTTMTVGPGSSNVLPVTASAAVSVGLREATIQARPSPTNPTGASVPAVYPAPATTYTGQTAVAVDRTAHPVVSTTLASGLVRAGAAFTPTAAVTGLNGHAATVSVDLLGPRPVRPKTLCAGLTANGWTAVADHTTGTLTGDGAVRAGPFTVSRPGCYAVRATVATTDATPAVTRRAALVTLAVLAVSVDGADAGPAVLSPSGPAGALTGAVRVGDTYGLSGTLELTLTGPIAPGDGNCAASASAWQHAATRTIAAHVPALAAAGRYAYTADGPSAVGCYRVRPVLTLTDGSGDRLSVPAGTAPRPAYVVRPTITAAVQQTWAVSPAAVPVQVSVSGLFGLPAHVRTRMYVRPADPSGCARATFTGAAAAAIGPATAVPATAGIVTVSVPSGPTPRIGCYAVVPELTVDANPKVSAAGALGFAGTTLIAGIDPNQHPKAAAQQSVSGGGIAAVVTAVCLVTVLLAVIARVVLLAWHERD